MQKCNLFGETDDISFVRTLDHDLSRDQPLPMAVNVEKIVFGDSAANGSVLHVPDGCLETIYKKLRSRLSNSPDTVIENPATLKCVKQF